VRFTKQTLVLLQSKLPPKRDQNAWVPPRSKILQDLFVLKTSSTIPLKSRNRFSRNRLSAPSGRKVSASFMQLTSKNKPAVRS